MCVAMGIKPRVHYQIGYPCKDIADLFEDEVSIWWWMMNDDE